MLAERWWTQRLRAINAGLLVLSSVGVRNAFSSIVISVSAGSAYEGSTRSMMLLSNRNKEYFLIILLSVVSPNLMAMHSHVLQRRYLGRRIFISIGLRDALLADRPHR